MNKMISFIPPVLLKLTGSFLPTLITVLLCLLLCFVSNVSFAKGNNQYDQLMSLISDEFEIMDVASGDLNGDSFIDYAVVLKSKHEERRPDKTRPLMLFSGSRKGELKLIERNDSVVLSKSSGGMFGDPFSSITIKNGILTIEHSIGSSSSWKWSRITSFTYDNGIREYVLHKDEEVSLRVSAARQREDLLNKENSSNLLLCNYAYDKENRKEVVAKLIQHEFER